MSPDERLRDRMYGAAQSTSEQGRILMRALRQAEASRDWSAMYAARDAMAQAIKDEDEARAAYFGCA